jgi:hypothetical protein
MVHSLILLLSVGSGSLYHCVTIATRMVRLNTSGTLAGHSSLGVAVTNQPIGSLPYNDTIEFEGSLEPFGTLAKSDSLTNFVTINQCGSLSYLCY